MVFSPAVVRHVACHESPRDACHLRMKRLNYGAEAGLGWMAVNLSEGDLLACFRSNSKLTALHCMLTWSPCINQLRTIKLRTIKLRTCRQKDTPPLLGNTTGNRDTNILPFPRGKRTIRALELPIVQHFVHRLGRSSSTIVVRKRHHVKETTRNSLRGR